MGAEARAEAPLSPLALLARCYAHLTGGRLPTAHPFRGQVTDAASAVDLCMSLLDKAALEASAGSPSYGRLKNESDPEAKAVLRNLNDFHRSWFSADDIAAAVPEGAEGSPLSQEWHDGGEGALHLTRALLQPGVPFSEIVTQSSGMEALRSSGVRTDAGGVEPLDGSNPRRFLTSPAPHDPAHGYDPVPKAVFFNPPPQLVQLGDLLGVRPIAANPAKQDLLAYTGSDVIGDQPYNYDLYYGYYDGLYLHRSLGGGILGTKSYLMLNLGRNDGKPMNGGLQLPRRWSKAVFHDLMCRDIPVVRLTDAQLFVQSATSTPPYVPNVTPPFRQSRTCMQCHAALDPMASAARNVSYVFLPERNPDVAEGLGVIQLYVWPRDSALSRESGQVDSDLKFMRRPTFGRLFYRTHDGQLVSKEVDGLPALGTAIAAQDEIYICAAQRYFRYFTGIGANTQDVGGIPALSITERTYRDKVIQWGRALKADPSQSLKKLVRAILSSDIYQDQTLRVPGSSP